MQQPATTPSRNSGRLLSVAAGAVLVAAAVIVIGLFVIQPDLTGQSVRTEVVKALIQLAVVGVAGALLTIVFEIAQRDRDRLERKAEKERERRRQDFDYKMELFRDIASAYNTVKSVRRTLNSAGDRESAAEHDPALATPDAAKVAVDPDVRSRQIERLNKAQLSFEQIMRVMRVRSAAFNGQTYDRLEADLRQMEGYVNRVIEGATDEKHREDFDAFLGDTKAPGGLTTGWETIEPKKAKEDGHGPSAVMWDVQELIARSFRESV